MDTGLIRQNADPTTQAKPEAPRAPRAQSDDKAEQPSQSTAVSERSPPPPKIDPPTVDLRARYDTSLHRSFIELVDVRSESVVFSAPPEIAVRYARAQRQAFLDRAQGRLSDSGA